MAFSGTTRFYNACYLVPLQVITFLQLCFFTLSLDAQRLPKGDALTIEDGLSFRDVTVVAQDKQGLMWFGTRQGLCRYDGYRFTRFGNDHGADQFFPGENIFSAGMHFVNDSTLWIIADNHLYRLNRNNFRYQDLTREMGIRGDVLQLQPSRDGSIWVVWEDAKNQYLCRSENGKPVKEIAITVRNRREFTSLAIDTSGNAWWSTISDGLRQISKNGEVLNASKPDSFNWYGTTMYYTPVFVDSHNRVFILPKSKYQIWWYHPQENRIEVIADSLSSVATYFVEDKQGKIWFSTYKQLLRWNPDRSWTDYSMVLKDALEFGSIRGLYEDLTNLLWIATDNGLIKLPNNSEFFLTKFNKPGENWGNAMRGIFDDQQGRIYAYCERGQVGLHCSDPMHGQLHDTMNMRTVRPDILLFEGAKHFIPDRNANTVWFLTDQLIEMDLARMSVKTSVDLEGIADKSALNPLARLHDGTFLLGNTLARLTICNTITREQKKLIRDTSSHLANVFTKYFLENKDGSIWVGTTNDGLYLIRSDGQIMRHLTIESKPALSNNHLIALYHDTDDVLWIGTFGGGLNRLDIRKDSIKVFTQKEGLANENVTGILSDAEGNIWASTYNGLSCYRIKEGSFQNFFEDDGLSNNEFNYTSFFKDRNGGLWFGGMNGVQYFDPATILQQRPNPPLTITGFLKYNRLLDSIDSRVLGSQSLPRVIISPYDSYFQFTWTLPNYYKPDKNRYYVWLEGLEKDWSYIGNIPTVRYHKLPAGHYTLHIKGADSKGNWSETELTVPIFVKPFFYSTWWFILCCILLIGSLVYSFTRYRLQRLLEMERMRTRIAGDLHDEVGSMLSGLAMQAEILELDQHKSDTARLHRISEISRLTLSKMRDVVWSIDSRRDQVKDLLDRMRENAEEMLTPKEIAFRFELGELPMEKKLKVDIRQHLFLFFKEAITNIGKHSNATTVTIRFGQFGDHFELSVVDNGTSFSSADSTGFGLQNMEMRAKKLGASFELKREHGFQVKLMRKSL